MLDQPDDVGFLKLQLDIAIKLYARARRIPLEDARDNVRDAAMIQIEGMAPKPDDRLPGGRGRMD